MAVRRKIGNLAGMLLQSRMQSQNQQNLAKLQDELRQKTADDTRKQAVLMRSLDSPEFGQRAFQAGELQGPREKYATPADQIMAGIGETLRTTKREELPDEVGVQSMIGAKPWGDQLAKDPRAVKEGIDMTARRSQALTDVDEYNTDLDLARAQGGAYSTAMGKEGADAVNAPAQLKRTLAEEQGKSNISLGADLTMQRRRHLDQIEQDDLKRIEERSKLPPAMAEKVAGIDSSLYSLGKIEALYSKPDVQDKVGPGAGRVARAREILPFVEPNDPEYGAFSAEVTTLNNNVIKAVTGAQMSDPEAKRIMSQVPSKLDKKPDFIAKARATRENLIKLRNQQITLVGSTGVPQTGMPDQPFNPDAAQTPLQQRWNRARGRQ